MTSCAKADKMNCLTQRLLFVIALLAAGCAEQFAPAISPIPSPYVKPGGKHEALVVLPEQALASVDLHYFYAGGRLAIIGVAVVNHNPEKVTLFFSRTQIYVGQNELLPVARYRDMDRNANMIDLRVMKSTPPTAEGKWIIPVNRYLTRETIGTPVVVIFYSVHGHDGFARIRYRAIWDITGDG